MTPLDTAAHNVTSRPFCAVEQGIDVFDRMATLNFTVAARIHGQIDITALTQGVRALERRHPLLRAGIMRANGKPSFVAGAAAPIPIIELHAPHSDTLTCIEPLLAHRVWSDEGPRATLHVIRHSEADTTLLLTPHHLVSDGSSGIIAMRDLLQFTTGERSLLDAPVASPGQQYFLAPQHRGFKAKLAAVRYALRTGLARLPLRLHAPGWLHDKQRHVALGIIRLDEVRTAKLREHARASGATVHGVLGAAFARAVAACADGHQTINITHAVDMRKYLRDQTSAALNPGEASGYYVSGVNTSHRLDRHQPLDTLAVAVTQHVHDSMQQGDPLLTIPHLVPWMAASTRRHGDLSSMGPRFEQLFFHATFGLTNLGPVESLNVTPTIGSLHIKDLYFCAAGSVFYSLGASVTTFAGCLTLVMNWLPSRLSAAQAKSILTAIESDLINFTNQPTA